MGYFNWAINRTIPLTLDLADVDGSGVTGATPEVGIRRTSDSQWWTGAAWTATPTYITMTEFDATNNPGLYIYNFAAQNVEETYRVYFRHTSIPIGFDTEIHIATNERVLPTGLRQVTIHVQDDVMANVVGAQVDVYDASNTIFLTRAFTDSGGDAVIALDDGTYQLRVFASGYTFTVPTPITVTMDETFTISGVNDVTIPVPSAPDLCVIFGTVRNAAGTNLAGVCVQAFAEKIPQVVGGTQLGEKIAEVRTNSNGFFSIELIRTSSVRFRIEGTDFDTVKTVPDAASQDVTTWP